MKVVVWQADESSVAELKTWFDQHGDTKWANFAGEVNTKTVTILRDHIPLQFLPVLPEFSSKIAVFHSVVASFYAVIFVGLVACIVNGLQIPTGKGTLGLILYLSQCRGVQMIHRSKAKHETIQVERDIIKVESIVACECECSVHPDGGRPSRTWSDCNEDMRKGQEENRRTREKVEGRRCRCVPFSATPSQFHHEERICPGNPEMRTWLERLGEEVNELLRIDEFGKGMHSGLDEAENLLCSHYCEIREWQPHMFANPAGSSTCSQPPSNIRYRTALAPERASQPSHAGTIALPLPTLDRV